MDLWCWFFILFLIKLELLWWIVDVGGLLRWVCGGGGFLFSIYFLN